MRELLKISIIGALGVAIGACTHTIAHHNGAPQQAPRPEPQSQASQRGPDSDTVILPLDATREYSQQVKQTKYFDWPVDAARMTRGFLPNRRKPHLGIDLAAPRGTNVYASHEGVVIYAGREFKGYGKMIMIEGKSGWATLYAHFSKILVKEGQTVNQGELIGAMGSTGRSTGSHVHFEIRRIKGPVDPLLYLPPAAKLAKNS